MRRRPALVGAAAVGYGLSQWLGRADGATATERTEPFPGDDLVDRAHLVTTHAVTIGAQPERVWPWLVQMGWGRGQWYTARWVDRLLFPDNGPSAERIVPELQDLHVGDRILDGPPEANCAFEVAELCRTVTSCSAHESTCPRDGPTVTARPSTSRGCSCSAPSATAGRDSCSEPAWPPRRGGSTPSTPWPSCPLTSSCPDRCSAASVRGPNGRVW